MATEASESAEQSCDDLVARLTEAFSELSIRPGGDCPSFNCAPENVVTVLRRLRDEWEYDMLMDVTAIDNGVEASPRFTVVYHVYSTIEHGYVRLAADLESDEEPACPSVVELWAGADWHERETYDMFGIRFEGHPDLRRILMWEGYPHYPLRKDFPLAGIEEELPAPDVAERTDAKVLPAPMMGGPFHSRHEGAMSKSEPRARDESWTEVREKPQKDES